MGLYSHYLNDNIELTVEDACIIYDSLIESSLDYEDDSIDYYTEGANLDLTKAFQTFKSEYKSEASICKSLIKQGKYNEAKQSVKKLQTIISKMEKEINSTKFTTGEALIGGLVQIIISIGKITLPMMILGLGIKIPGLNLKTFLAGDVGKKVLSISKGYTFIMDIVEAVKLLINQQKLPRSKQIGIQSMNFYINAMRGSLDKYKKSLDKFSRAIDEKAKNNK